MLDLHREPRFYAPFFLDPRFNERDRFPCTWLAGILCLFINNYKVQSK